MVSDALHPLTGELQTSPASLRKHTCTRWQQRIGEQGCIPAWFISGRGPLVLSVPLANALTTRVQAICASVQPWVQAHQDAHWGGVPALDVLSVDFALTAEPEGTSLQLVELQAFTSVVATVSVLHSIQQELWPQIAGLRFHGPCSDWHQEVQEWLAPHPSSALLEVDPWTQRTSFDFAATRRLFGVSVVDLRDVQASQGSLQCRPAAGPSQISHVLNRVIPHGPAVAPLRQLAAQAAVTWHSHPAGYDRVNKALMAALPLPLAEKTVLATHWTELGIPASEIVLKAAHSYGGADVHLHVTEQDIANLPNPEQWMAQRRFRSATLGLDAAGLALHAEIRCIVALRHGKTPWIAAQFARVFTGAKASASGFSSESTGLALVLYPPGTAPHAR